ncbi:MAG: hypothetical protein Tsb0033_27790 [Winogradskyella sp.]
MSDFIKKRDSEIRKSELGKEILIAIKKVSNEYPELNEQEISIVLLKEAQAINQKQLNFILKN